MLKNVDPNDCPNYKEILTKTHGEEPTRALRRRFLEEHFKVVGSHLSFYSNRTSYESIVITLTKPKLNEQVKHSAVKLI